MIRYHLFNMSIAEKMYKATLSQISIFEIIIIVMMSLLSIIIVSLKKHILRIIHRHVSSPSKVEFLHKVYVD